MVDSAQIEARVLAWLADDTPTQPFAGADVYKIWQQDYETMSASHEQRFVGKVATLGLGYGIRRNSG